MGRRLSEDERRHRAAWRRLWRRIHERTTISEAAAKHAAAIALEFFAKRRPVKKTIFPNH